MMAAREPLAPGQKLIEMTPPTRWVLPAAESLHLGGIKHALDAASKARSGFGFFTPERLQDPQHVIGADLVHGQPAEGRRIHSQSHFPLRCVLVVAPGGAHGLNKPVSTFAKRDS